LSKTNTDGYLSPQEACTYLGVARRTLERYVEAGRITKYRSGIKRAVFFKKEELDRLLEIHAEEKGEEL